VYATPVPVTTAKSRWVGKDAKVTYHQRLEQVPETAQVLEQSFWPAESGVRPQ